MQTSTQDFSLFLMLCTICLWTSFLVIEFVDKKIAGLHLHKTYRRTTTFLSTGILVLQAFLWCWLFVSIFTGKRFFPFDENYWPFIRLALINDGFALLLYGICLTIKRVRASRNKPHNV